MGVTTASAVVEPRRERTDAEGVAEENQETVVAVFDRANRECERIGALNTAAQARRAKRIAEEDFDKPTEKKVSKP